MQIFSFWSKRADQPIASPKQFNSVYDIATKAFKAQEVEVPSAEICLNPHNYLEDIRNTVKAELLEHESNIYGVATAAINIATTRAEELLSEGKRAEAVELLDACRKKVGQMLYLADYRSELLDDPSSLAGIDKLYDNTMNKLAGHIDEIVSHQAQLGLQDPSMLRETLVARLFSQVCVTKSGMLNLGLVDDLNERFLGGDKYEWQRDMRAAMSALREMPRQRQRFYELRDVPLIGDTLMAHRAICAMLGTPACSELGDRQARQAVFMAYITRLRQGPVGSCFADAVGLAIQHARRNQYLRDLVQIMMTEGIERKLDGAMEVFHPTLSVADDSLEKPLFVRGDSVSLSADGPAIKIWQVSGLVAAYQAYDKKPSKDMAKLIEDMDGKTITASEIIERMKGNTERRKLAYTAQTQNILLRMWENTLAGLAEAKKGDVFRNAVVGSVVQGIQPTQDALKALYPKATAAAVKAFYMALNKSIELRYDQDMPNVAVAADGASHAGGFELYRRDRNVRVGTPTQLVDLITAVLKDSQAKLLESKIGKASADVFKQIFARLESDVTDKDQHFLRRCFGAFSNVNKVGDPLQNWEKLQMSPLWAKTGDNPIAIWDVYLSALGRLTEEHTTPQNATELLTWSVREARKLNARDKFVEKNETWRAYPSMVWGVHAFRLLPMMDGFKDLVTSKRDPLELVSERLDAPGDAVAQTRLDAASVEKIRDFLKNYIKAEIPEPSAPGLTVQQYGQELVAAFSKQWPTKQSLIEGIVTGAVLSKLGDETLKPLKDSVIKVFDTNWQLGNENLYFCFFKDPVMGKIILGVTNEDGTVLNSRNQAPWIQGTWEIAECPFIAETANK